MRYLPHTPQDVATMLQAIGVSSIDDLFESIPESIRHSGGLDLPAPLSESELFDHLAEMAADNRPADRARGDLVFAGAGLYPHNIPSAVDALSLRGEFATAYTPYQAELSQGTLTAIFEFQTMVCELFGTEYANASMYDGASAAAEGVLMARRLTKRTRTIVSRGLHPEYRETCATYLSGIDETSTLVDIAQDANGATDRDQLAKQLTDDVACVIVQTPNVLGVVEDLQPLADAVHAVGALLVVACPEPLALALVESPGRCGADIVVGEGIGLASRPTLGAPGVGLLGASGKRALRAMPGRLVGQTVDKNGVPGFVLTLSTREQHIRREKATSNICTNHGLYALRFAIHLALLGKTGFEQLAQQVLSRTYYARQQLAALPDVELLSQAPVFNEFAVRVPGDAHALVERCAEQGVVPGVAYRCLAGGHSLDSQYSDVLLVSVHERHRKQDIDRLGQVMQLALGGGAA